MIISHKHKYIFVKTKKTAGTSMEIALSQFCGNKDIVWNLMEEDELVRQNFGFTKPRNWSAPLSSYTFSDWKNLLFTGKRRKKPFTRHSPAIVVKQFLGEEMWNRYFKFCFERNPFDRAISFFYWKTRDISPLPDINRYIQSCTQNMLSNWSKYTINDHVVMDFVGRYENLDDDLILISKRLGLPNLSLPNVKGNTRTNREHYSCVLTRETREYIEKMCASEFEYFGYKWISA